jgi:flagellar basal-body rod protein FlgB
MDAARTGLIALAERRLGWLDQRQRVLSANIANGDTPGYRPRDTVPFAEHLKALQGGAAASAGATLARTDTRHLAPSGEAGAVRAPRDRKLVETTPTGNAVSLDEQALKVADTDTAHALAMGLHRRWMDMFRTALGRG